MTPTTTLKRKKLNRYAKLLEFVNKREKISDALKLAKQNDIKETKSMKKIFKRKLLE